MLVLTRKSNQSIMIGDDIEVSVLAIMGEKVRIGIEAPRSIPVFRKEVYLEIRQDSSPEDAVQEVDAALEKLKTQPEPKTPSGRPRDALGEPEGEHLKHPHGDQRRRSDDREHQHHEARRRVPDD